MAILFTTDIATDKLLLAYVNNVVYFKSDSLLVPKKATITIGTSVKTLYPHPNGSFYFNFKEWITSIMNVDNFKDDLVQDIAETGYIYDWTSKVFLNSDVIFAITLSDLSVQTATRNIKVLSGLLQLEDYKIKYPINSSLTHPVILSPYAKAGNNSCFLKHWEGYPFDITVYTGTTTNLKVTNLTNLLDYTFSTTNKVNRLCLSDGNTTTTIEGVLPLIDGLNSLKLTSNTFNYYATIEKINDTCKGHYLKWINELGGYNYWFFNNGNKNRKVKDLGELENDTENFTDTISPSIQVGKTSNDTLTVSSDILSEDENILLSGIIDSPKIYLFTGQPFAKANFNDWIEVSLNSTDFRIMNAKNVQNKMNFTFELPQRNTRKL